MSFTLFASYIAIWILVLFQGLLVLALLRQLAELRRLVELGGLQDEDRLPMGSAAPEFAGLDVRSGQRIGLQSLSGLGGVILFLSPDCNVCNGLANSLRQPAINSLPPIIVFCQGAERGCARFRERLGPEVHLLFQGAEQAAARYHVSGSPTAVVVDGDRKIRGYGHPQEIEDLKGLLARRLPTESATAKVEKNPHLVVFDSTVAP